MKEALKNVLIASYNNSQYYYEIYKKCNLSLKEILKDENFKRIPILTRKALVDNFEKILCKEYKFLKRKQLYLVQTSGSSGNFVDVLWKPSEYLSSNLSLWRKRKKWYGITPRHRKCAFVSGTIVGSTVTGNNNSMIYCKDNVLELSVLNMSDEVMEKFYKKICEFEPDWMYTPQSALMLFIDFCIRKNYRNFEYIKYIELATEQVLPSTYDYIKNFFDVPIAIMYGSKEVNGIALTCPKRNNLHILEDNVYVEQTIENKILVTSLKNTVFPLIRYELGDVISISNCKCECGNKDVIIEEMKGRERILNYVTNNGTTTTSIINCIFVVNARLDYPFLQYKLKETKTCLIIQLVLKRNFRNWETSIRNELLSCLDNFSISCDKILIEFYDSPLDINTETGKLCLLEKGG